MSFFMLFLVVSENKFEVGLSFEVIAILSLFYDYIKRHILRCISV